ncbi:MAG: polysaccharide biosynthesis/export family protein [Thainema sp.]
MVIKHRILRRLSAAGLVMGFSLTIPTTAWAQMVAQRTDTDAQMNLEEFPGEEADGNFEQQELEPGEEDAEPETVVPEQPRRFVPDIPDSPTVSFEQFGNVDYILGSGDQIAITVFGYEEFEGSRVVLPDGTISIPLLGPIRAEGRTTESLSRELTSQLSAYLVNPSVDVSLTVLRPVVVNIAGEVHRPGPVQLSSLTDVRTRVDTNSRITSSSTSPTLSTALGAAGGVRSTADIRRVIVQRSLPGNKSESIEINLWNAIWSDDVAADPILRDGDSIYIPEVTDGTQFDPRLVATSTFAPDTIQVRVVGEVENPGPIEISPDSSVSSAIAVAGGPTEDAELDEVVLVRLNRDGEIAGEEIDVEDLVDNYQVREGDVIVVPQEGSRSFLDFIPRVLGPIGDVLDIFSF